MKQQQDEEGDEEEKEEKADIYNIKNLLRPGTPERPGRGSDLAATSQEIEKEKAIILLQRLLKGRAV